MKGFIIVGAEFVTEELIFQDRDGERWVSDKTLNDFTLERNHDNTIYRDEIEKITADLYPWH